MNQPSAHTDSIRKIAAPMSPRARRGAIGKALLVWLLSGSFGIAVIAFLIFAMMGC